MLLICPGFEHIILLPLLDDEIFEGIASILLVSVSLNLGLNRAWQVVGTQGIFVK